MTSDGSFLGFDTSPPLLETGLRPLVKPAVPYVAGRGLSPNLRCRPLAPDDFKELGQDHGRGTPNLMAAELVEGNGQMESQNIPCLPADDGRVEEMLKRDFQDFGHLLRLGTERGASRKAGNGGVDTIVADRNIQGCQATENPGRPESDSQLLRGLTEGGFLEGLSRMPGASRERDLSPMSQDGFRPPGKEDMRMTIPGIDEGQDSRLEARVFDVPEGSVPQARLGSHPGLNLGPRKGTPEVCLQGPKNVPAVFRESPGFHFLRHDLFIPRFQASIQTRVDKSLSTEPSSKIEWDQRTLGDFQIFSGRARAFKAEPRMTSAAEHDVEKNGIRFPGRDTLEEASLQSSKKPFVMASTVILCKDYGIFTMETNIVFRRKRLPG